MVAREFDIGSRGGVHFQFGIFSIFTATFYFLWAFFGTTCCRFGGIHCPSCGYLQRVHLMFVVREVTLRVRGQQGRLGTSVCYQKLRFGKTTKPDKTSSSSSGRTSVSNSKSPGNTPPKDGRHPEPYEAWRPPGQPKSPPIPPEVVAMAEFAALERKLAANAAPSSATSRDHVVSRHSSSRRKTVGQGDCIEEGAVLESNTGASGRIKASSLGKASSSSFPRPEVRCAQCNTVCKHFDI